MLQWKNDDGGIYKINIDKFILLVVVAIVLTELLTSLLEVILIVVQWKKM